MQSLTSKRVSILSAIVASILVSSMFAFTPNFAQAQAPNVSVATQDVSGTVLTGYWVEVVNSAGSVVQSGFSPAQFALPAGNYQVGVGDYGSEYFNHWSDGTTTRFHPIVVGTSGSVSLAAIYCPSSGCGGASISVKSQYSSGASLTGMYTTLQQGGNTIATGFTPTSFSVTSGQSYVVTVGDYTNTYFYQWSDGICSRSRSVTATSSQTALTAIYTTTAQTPPSCVGTTGGSPDSITVTGVSLNGSSVNGIFVDLRVNGTHIASGYTPVTFGNLQLGVQYGVVVYWYGNYYIRHINDANSGLDLQRYDLVTLNSSKPSDTLTAVFEYVPPSKAVSLNIIAEFPNGTQIGTASVVNGYDLHTPGMWLTLTPPFQSTPYTGTFTGGSILPFILFNGETYTVQMTTSYNNIYFDYWQDTGSTNPTRVVTLNGNMTLVAIYVQK